MAQSNGWVDRFQWEVERGEVSELVHKE